MTQNKMISSYEEETIKRIKQLSENVKEKWLNVPIEDFFDKCTDNMGDFGMTVYNYLIERGYVRDNLTIKDCIESNSFTLNKIIQSMLIIREEYNGELTEENIDDDTEDFSNYAFGELVLTVIYGKKRGYNYNYYPSLQL